jgi:hypothetical protein
LGEANLKGFFADSDGHKSQWSTLDYFFRSITNFKVCMRKTRFLHQYICLCQFADYHICIPRSFHKDSIVATNIRYSRRGKLCRVTKPVKTDLTKPIVGNQMILTKDAATSDHDSLHSSKLYSSNSAKQIMQKVHYVYKGPRHSIILFAPISQLI